ncbi:MAG TPA: GNAT family N-acetyltransferase [Pseudolysinimonas sp.]|jgi:phosphinothricin acetyltransferase
MTALRRLTESDWSEVAAIYRAGIDTGNATFETAPPTWDRFASGHLLAHSAVAVDGGRIVGWVSASPVSARAVYAGVVEHSVYVHPDAAGQGVGGELVAWLISSTEAAGIWTIQSSIFPENAASLRLHRRLGFRVVGGRERIGRMSFGPFDGQWRDTVLIERRSGLAGVD